VDSSLLRWCSRFRCGELLSLQVYVTRYKKDEIRQTKASGDMLWEDRCQ
jgi:hypothetical protein